MNLFLSPKSLIQAVFISSFTIFLVACSSEPPAIEVLPQAQQYVDRFIEEGAARGETIDFADTGLSIVFRDAVSKESGGVCLGNHQIEIEKFFWDGLSDREREGLIFHELGHCELLRPHRNEKLANGEWASRMRGDPIPEGANAVINYSGTRRTYYIDEMFDSDIPAPSWVGRRLDYDAVAPDDKNNLLDQFYIEGISAFDENVFGLVNGNFEIEVTLNSGESEGFVGMQVLGTSNDDRIRIAFSRDGEFIIDSGPAVWDLMYYEENQNGVDNLGNNKLGLRRVDDFYYVYLNDEFVYWFDYKRPTSSAIVSLNSGALGNPNFKSIRAYTIP